jgi:CheY-like chemotaxis protein
VDTIRNCGEALLTIINDILDLSKIEAGKMELKPADFDLRDMIEEFIATLAVTARAKKIDLTSVISPSVPQIISGDSGRLRQILINLTGNATKFTEKGGVTVYIDALETPPPAVGLSFKIVDTGIGIPPDKLEMLFKPFSQVHNTGKNKFGGTGLGLSISKKLIEMMGGSITVSSEEGKGSEFKFSVMLAEAADPEARTKTARAIKVEHLPSGVRILCADRCVPHLRSITALLDSWRLRSEPVESPAAALAALRKAAAEGEPFNMALVNTDDPGAAEFLESAALDRSLPPLRIIAMTADVKPDAEGAPSARLCAGKVFIPVKRRQLYDTLISAAPGAARDSGEGFSPDQRPAERSGEERHIIPDLKILLAEDNTVNQKVAVKLLATLGLKSVDIAGNGQEAVEAAMRSYYDVIFMDCEMPVMDGYEAVAEIRKMRGGATAPDVPVVAMTANAMEGDKERCLAAGMDDYVSKPVHAHDIKLALERILS